MMSGESSVDSISTLIASSVAFEIWCAPRSPRGKATTSPSASSCSPSIVLSVGRPRSTIAHSSFA
jgi:hypothetical protein